MTSIEIALDENLIAALADSFKQGPMLDADGTRFLTEDLVARVDGLKIHIFADEHPPPHFCVSHQGQAASFSIDGCERLRGNKGLERFEWNIRRWWADNKDILIDKWNSGRPSDCPVGPIRRD